MQRIKIFLSIIFICLISVKAQNHPNLYQKADLVKMNHWVDSIFSRMTFDEKIGQLFMIVVDPGTGDVNTKKIIKHINEQKIGGILFSKGTLKNQATATNLYQKSSKIPLLISFDGEWGLAMRLENTPQFPKNITLGAIQNNRLIFSYGEEVGRACREIGVHINFAPVLDINTNPDNPVIGYRSFGEEPFAVAKKGIAYSTGLESTGVISVAKHFPGHGDTSEDSHETLPSVNKSLERLKDEDLEPFKHYINSGFAGVMSGHLSVPALDNKTGKPTSLSPKIITDLLQNEMNFRGLSFTDALVMKGASGDTESVCVDALLAGNDILLSPANPISEFNAVKRAIQQGIIDAKLLDEKCKKILRYKYIAGLNNYNPIELNGLSKRIDSEYARWLIGKLSDEAITLLKNDNASVPVKNLENKKVAVLSIGESDTEFQQMISNYKQADFFNIPRNASDAVVDRVFRNLSKYNLIICGIHHHRMPDYPQLQKLSKEKDVYLSFFVTPYYMSRFQQSIANAKVVVCGYENLPEIQKSAVQVIMGGLPAKGKLPVTVTGLFNAGDGFETSKTRLAYQYPMEVKLSESKLSRIDAIVKDGLKNEAFPGCQILVAKDGAVIYNKSFGFFDFAGTHAVQNTDIYDLASVTKAAATLPAIMKLYDEKKLKLTDYLSAYIPQLKETDKESITVRQALFHESGLVSFLAFYRLAIDPESLNSGSLYSTKRDETYRIQYDEKTYVRTDFEFNKDRVSPTAKPGFSLQVAKRFYLKDNFPDLVIKDIANSRLRNQGTYIYSDLNFMLLKEVVENISKEPINKFLETNFYAPLGADLLGYNPLSRKIDSLKIAPTENDQFIRNQILIGFPHDEAAAFMGGVSGNAGLFSNANDLAKLLQMLLNQGIYGDKRYLSSETCKLFMNAKSSVSRRGMGFDKPDMENEKINPTGKLAPASTIGHTGFTGTCFWIDPDNQLIYIFLSNRIYPSRTNKELMKLNIRSRIQDVIYEAME